MAGIPLLNGFLSKEMMLEEAAHTPWLGTPGWCRRLRPSARWLSAAYSFRFIAHVFLGPARHDYPRSRMIRAFGFWIAPAILVVLVVAIGVLPRWWRVRWWPWRRPPSSESAAALYA